MPAIGSGDAAIIRYRYQRMADVFLNIVQLVPDADASATVDATPSSFPVATVSVTGAGANFSGRQEVLVRITKPDGSIAYQGMNRTGTTSTTCPIIAVNDGDNIVPHEFAQSIETGDTVQLYTARIPQAFYSRFDYTTGDSYKLYNVAYTDQNEDPAPFSSIAEGNLHFRVAPGAKATFDLNADEISWTGNAVTLTWVLPAGMTITAGTVNSASITVEADPGAYVVRLFVEDDVTGYEDVARRQIWVTDGSTSLAFSDQYAVSIESDRQDTIGRVMTFRVEVDAGTDMSAWFYPGAQCLFTYRHEFSDDAWLTISTPAAGTLVESFYGYLRFFEQIAYDNAGIDVWIIRVEAPMVYFKSLQIPTQTVIATAAPTTWEQIIPALCNVEYVAFHLLRWHTRGVENLNGFNASALAAFSQPALSVRNTNIADAFAQLAYYAGASGRFGSLSNGTIYGARHPSLEGTTYRASVANQWTWADTDIIGGLEYDRDLVYRVSELEAAFAVSGTSTPITGAIARAGIFAPSQGTIKQREDDFVCLSATTDGQDRVGHLYQRHNRPTQTIQFEVPMGFDFTEPARHEFQTMAVSGYDPLDCGIWESRIIPTEVSRFWEVDDAGDVVKRVMITAEPETRGKRAPLKPLEPLGDYMVITPPLVVDFKTSMGGFEPVPNTSPNFGAEWILGTGWNWQDWIDTGRYNRGVQIARDLDNVTVTQVSVTYQRGGTGTFLPSSSGAFLIALINNGVTIELDFVPSTSFGITVVPTTRIWSPLNPVVADRILIYVLSSSNGIGTYGGSASIEGITITTV